MAGRPKFRALCARIEEAGGDDAVLDLIRDGMTLTKVGEEFGVSRRMIYTWANQNPDRRAAYDQAQKDSADALADKATDAHEELAKREEPSPGAVSATKNRSDHLMRLAALRNREKYSERGATDEMLQDLGGIFLQALQEHGRVVRGEEHQALPAPEPVTVDAELIEEDDDMATPRMQRKLEALEAARARGIELSERQLEQVASGEPITPDPEVPENPEQAALQEALDDFEEQRRSPDSHEVERVEDGEYSRVEVSPEGVEEIERRPVSEGDDLSDLLDTDGE